MFGRGACTSRPLGVADAGAWRMSAANIAVEVAIGIRLMVERLSVLRAWRVCMDGLRALPRGYRVVLILAHGYRSPPPTPPRRAASLGVLVVCFLLAEVGARSIYSAPWYEQLAEEQAEHRELSYERNHHNLRGPAHDHAKPVGVQRVLFLGDSFTFGMGVPRDEDTFVRILERDLTDRLSSAGVERVEVHVAHGNPEGQGFWRSRGFSDLMDVLHRRM